MIICCGEALIDMLPRNVKPHGEVFMPVAGGSVFNTAIALGRLGEKSGFFCGLSNDRFGRHLEVVLKASSVDCSLCIRSERPTTLAFMELIDGQADYTFYDEGSAGQMLSEDQLPIIGSDVEAMLFGGISLIPEPCGGTYEKLVQREAATRVIYIDPNIRPSFVSDPDRHRARIQRMIAVCDIVKVSDQDLAWIEPDLDEEDVVQKWLAGATSLVLITRGDEGSEAYTKSGMIKASVIPSNVVDTIGAGDSFNAGILSGLRESGLLNKSALANAEASNLRPALKRATKVAAITVSRVGADPPWKSEL
jgi:fructokinase